MELIFPVELLTFLGGDTGWMKKKRLRLIPLCVLLILCGEEIVDFVMVDFFKLLFDGIFDFVELFDGQRAL